MNWIGLDWVWENGPLSNSGIVYTDVQSSYNNTGRGNLKLHSRPK